MQFEWNPKKAKNNERIHGVSFVEASSIFGDPLALTFPDPDHSREENRFLSIGLSQSQRMLIVSHAQRGEWTRIISARKVTRGERVFYEEG